MIKIALTRNKLAIIDDDKHQLIRMHKWYYLSNGYAATSTSINGTKKMIYMHRLIMGTEDPLNTVDHIDGNKLNNTVKNLRICKHSENCQNRKKSKSNTSGYKGVYKDKERNCWQVKIMINYKNKFIGRFKTKTAAAKAYNDAALQYFGKFAKLNKIREL